jgi:hypothetical protein
LRRAETPLDNNDHALDALRYLIASIDARVLLIGNTCGVVQGPFRRHNSVV